MAVLLFLNSPAQLGLFQDDAAEVFGQPEELPFQFPRLPQRGIVSGSFTDGSASYSGSTRYGQLHGYWNSWYSNNQRFETGRLKKGLPDGEWRVWYPNGQLRYIRNYSADKWKRVQQQLLRPHPKLPQLPIARVYQKNPREAGFLLKSRYSFLDSRYSKSYQAVFTDCLHHGLFMNFYPDGKAKDSGAYRNGLKEGVWIESGDNEEEFWTGAYSHGWRNGSWKRYNRQKRLLELVAYRSGKPEWTKKY